MYKIVKPRQRVALAGFARLGKDAVLSLVSLLGWSIYSSPS